MRLVFGVLAAIALAFLTLPVVAIFLRVSPATLVRELGDPVARDALVVSLRTSAAAQALVVALGTPTAYLLATRRFRGRSVVLTLVELPLVLPPAVAGIGLLAAFADVDPTLVAAARTLGASRWRVFSRVALPLAAGGLGAGLALSFARGLGEFGATIMFAGSLQHVTQTLPLAIYAEFARSFDVALAIGALLVAFSFGLLLAVKWLRFDWTSSPRFAPSISG